MAVSGSGWDIGRSTAFGRSVLWRSKGKGDRAPILLVHGGLRGKGTSSKPFELLSPLSEERPLFSWDQLGCGESDPPASPETWGLSRYAEEVEIVRHALLPEPLHLFGASLGSAIAIEWLVTHKPAGIRSITLMCPIVDGARAQSSLAAALAASGADFPRRFITRRSPPADPGGVPDPIINRVVNAELSTWNRTTELKTLPAPVLFMRGEHDYITEADMNAYAALCPGSKTATISGAAHLAFIDDPATTCSIVRKFLMSVEAR
ncbi:MAG TPA: alpha/beta fold hydrolase [Alphaproteobacteria bacterium]|nr:alpha/beta fold hydrolase [Alphaproteobacteria bacterium]